MKKLFAALLRELGEGRGTVLCSVVASHGSTPRGAGARMLVTAEGDTAGTVGGGAVEHRAGALARSMLAERRSGFETYRLSAGEIAQRLEQNRSHVHASFILDTLDFMRAGGRCSTVAAVSANLLSLKPCIEVDNTDGSMHVGKKYRGNLRKVLPSYVKDKLAQYPRIKKDHIFITYSSIDPELEELVRETIKSAEEFMEIHATRASCTIASHCGPNTLGILFETED